VVDAEMALGLDHFQAAETGEVALGHGVAGQGLVQDAPPLAARAAHDEHIRAPAPVIGVRRSALARLVVGVGMNGQQSQCHETPQECQLTLDPSLIVEP
jgi:hypothetical protein